MSRPRFLADHDLKHQIVSGIRLRESALELTTVSELGMELTPDPDLLAYAAEQGLIIISHDVNTMPGHAYGRIRAGLHVAGVFMVAQSKPIAAVIECVVMVWATSNAEEWHERVEFLPF